MRTFGFLCFTALVFFAGYAYGSKASVQSQVKDKAEKIQKQAKKQFDENAKKFIF
jgi:hypothetical protein